MKISVALAALTLILVAGILAGTAQTPATGAMPGSSAAEARGSASGAGPGEAASGAVAVQAASGAVAVQAASGAVAGQGVSGAVAGQAVAGDAAAGAASGVAAGNSASGSAPLAGLASRVHPTFQDTAPAFVVGDLDHPTLLARTREYLRSIPPQQLWALHMAPVLAAEADLTAAPSDAPPYTPAELEDFRDQLDTFTVDLEGLVGLFPDAQVMDVRQRLEAMRPVLSGASQEELAQLKEVFSAYPGYWNTATHMRAVLEGRSSAPGAAALPGVPSAQMSDLLPVALPTVPTGQKPVLAGCKDFGGDGVCDKCPADPAGGSSTVFALDMAAFATGSSCQFIPPDLLAGTTTVPNPVNVICTSIRVGLELAKEAVDLAHELNGECETQMRRNIVLYYLDETVSSRASQQSHDHHNAWELRLEIEHDLLNVLDDRVSLLQLPAAQGGYLDATDGLSVRWIVADTIRMQEAAGYTGELIRNAKDEYAAAEVLLAQGDYKRAYARYRLSYRAAVRVGREP